jgi:hypothetical protein
MRLDRTRCNMEVQDVPGAISAGLIGLNLEVSLVALSLRSVSGAVCCIMGVPVTESIASCD